MLLKKGKVITFILKSLDIQGHALVLLNLGDVFSSSSVVPGGVLQDSILDPILFSLETNNHYFCCINLPVIVIAHDFKRFPILVLTFVQHFDF